MAIMTLRSKHRPNIWVSFFIRNTNRSSSAALNKLPSFFDIMAGRTSDRVGFKMGEIGDELEAGAGKIFCKS